MFRLIVSIEWFLVWKIIFRIKYILWSFPHLIIEPKKIILSSNRFFFKITLSLGFKRYFYLNFSLTYNLSRFYRFCYFLWVILRYFLRVKHENCVVNPQLRVSKENTDYRKGKIPEIIKDITTSQIFFLTFYLIFNLRKTFFVVLSMGFSRFDWSIGPSEFSKNEVSRENFGHNRTIWLNNIAYFIY